MCSAAAMKWRSAILHRSVWILTYAFHSCVAWISMEPGSQDDIHACWLKHPDKIHNILITSKWSNPAAGAWRRPAPDHPLGRGLSRRHLRSLAARGLSRRALVSLFPVSSCRQGSGTRLFFFVFEPNYIHQIVIPYINILCVYWRNVFLCFPLSCSMFFLSTEELCGAYAVRKNMQLVGHEKQNTTLAYSRSPHDRLPRPASKTMKTNWTSTRNSGINDLLSWPHKTYTHTHELHAHYEQLQVTAGYTLSSSFLEMSEYLHIYIYICACFSFSLHFLELLIHTFMYTYIYIYRHITVDIYIHQCNRLQRSSTSNFNRLQRLDTRHSIHKGPCEKRESCL